MDTTLTISRRPFKATTLLRILSVILSAGVLLSVIIFLLENRRLDATSVVLRPDFAVEFGQTVKVSDLLAELNGELVEDFIIPTDTLGPAEVDFEYINIRGRKRPSQAKIEVVDRTPPRIYGSSSYTVYTGYKGDLTNLMLSGDDLDDHPTREVLGIYDLDAVGSYSLEYAITDASGNRTTQPFTLHVVDPPTNSPSNSAPSEATQLPLADVIAEHKTPQTKIGIDVSAWQGEIDWPQVKAAGVEFAFLRIGYQVGYGGEYVLDRYFWANYEGATAVGLPIGVYFYSYADSTDQAAAQAEWVLAQLDDHPLSLGIAFDWEDWGNFNQTGMSFRTLNQVADTYLKTVRAAGYQPSLYGSKNYLTNLWELEDYPVWVAQYYHRVTYEKPYWVWQMSDSGRVPGIDGPVDLDIMYLK